MIKKVCRQHPFGSTAITHHPECPRMSHQSQHVEHVREFERFVISVIDAITHIG